MDFRFWILDFGFWILDWGLGVTNYQLPITNYDSRNVMQSLSLIHAGKKWNQSTRAL